MPAKVRVMPAKVRAIPAKVGARRATVLAIPAKVRAIAAKVRAIPAKVGARRATVLAIPAKVRAIRTPIGRYFYSNGEDLTKVLEIVRLVGSKRARGRSEPPSLCSKIPWVRRNLDSLFVPRGSRRSELRSFRERPVRDE